MRSQKKEKGRRNVAVPPNEFPEGNKESPAARQPQGPASPSDSERSRELLEWQTKFKALLNGLPDLVFVLDAEGRFLDYHTSGPGLYLSPSVFLGKRHDDVMPPELCALFAPAFQRAKKGELAEYSYPLEMPDGRRWYTARISPWMVNDEFHGVVVVIREITERKVLEEKLTAQTITDGITGLPNRVLFLDRLTQCVRRLQRAPETGAVLLLFDVDHFKFVNDAVGQSGGDHILREIGVRLRTVLRPFDTVARLGSDEFAVLVEGFADETEALRIAGRLAEAMKPPFHAGGHSLTLTGSVGILIIKPPFADPSQLLAEAELAVGKAKQQGAGSQVIFDVALHEHASRQLELERDLREALEREELEVYFQPVVELTTGKVVGVEALSRWFHPKKGEIVPAEFIPIAEESGLIYALDRLVCRQACAQLAKWLRDHPKLDNEGFWVSVNFSPRHVIQASFAEEILGILKAVNLAPHHLKIEVTESLLLGSFDQARRTLEELARKGIDSCLDDFGAGYSALGYLLNLPIRVLKMDMSFVQQVPGTSVAEGVVQTIVGLSDHLPLSIVGEGVQTMEQAHFLAKCGCRFAQGFYFGMPMPAARLEELLRNL
ncbi:MAG: EAL domain-containing protein [Candidatus Sumerlaeaceae bacterium]|nr:EAL domain-containing protein [Candidatus Sumerlaeaceae bacterium]